MDVPLLVEQFEEELQNAQENRDGESSGENESSQEPVGFARGLEPEEIVLMDFTAGGLQYLILWKGKTKLLLPCVGGNA